MLLHVIYSKLILSITRASCCLALHSSLQALRDIMMQPLWHDNPDVARRLGYPTHHPGGPVAVPGAAAGSRQRVGEFQQQAAAALAALAAEVEAGVSALQAKADPGTASDQGLQPLDASDLYVPKLPRNKSTGMLLVVPAGSAAAAGPAAASAQASPLGPQPVVLPISCLQLAAWREAADAAAGGAAPPPFGAATAGKRYKPVRMTASSMPGTGAGGSSACSSSSSGEGPQPGRDVVVTFVVFEPERGGDKIIMQEVQALGSNTLAELRDALSCPTDALAAGMGLHNPAAYFFLGDAFYDDTRQVDAGECSLPLRRWVAQVGATRPQRLYKPPEWDADEQQQQHCLLEQQLPPQLQQQQQHEAQHASGEGTMQHTRIADLCLQVSNRAMGLYCHQGCCEHAVMISDVRLLHPADLAAAANTPPAAAAAAAGEAGGGSSSSGSQRMFPRTLSRAPVAKRFACSICRRQGAGVLLLRHPHAPEEVVMLCGRCEGLFDAAAGGSDCRKIVLAAAWEAL